MKPKLSMKQMLENKNVDKCKWCGNSFQSERTMSVHMCPKKRRWADKDTKHIQLGYRVFQKFYELNTFSSKPKSIEDFIRSNFYEGFVKFGRSCVRNEYLEPEMFAEWLIKNAKKLADWHKDALYDEFLLGYVRKESGIRALERGILYLSEWSEESGKPWDQYFKEVTTPRAIHDIRAAKISPWLLYLSVTGDELLTRLGDEQVKMIEHVIDANFWMALFAKSKEEVREVKSILEAAGL